MPFFFFLFVVSSFLWILSYGLILWPSLLSPLLWLVGSTADSSAVASAIMLSAFVLQLLLLVFAYLMYQGRRSLHEKLHHEASKNIALSERTKSITAQLEKQEKELKASQTEAQQLVVYKERVQNLQQLVDELKSRTGDLAASNERMTREVAQLRSGKPQGFFASLQSWIEKILP